MNALTVEDLKAALSAPGGSPSVIYVPDRVWLRLMRVGVSKRRFRRLRGRLNAERRALRRREAALPEGLFEDDGRLTFDCRGCGASAEFEGYPHEFSGDTAYCGGSPRCVP